MLQNAIPLYMIKSSLNVQSNQSDIFSLVKAVAIVEAIEILASEDMTYKQAIQDYKDKMKASLQQHSTSKRWWSLARSLLGLNYNGKPVFEQLLVGQLQCHIFPYIPPEQFGFLRESSI